MMLGSQLHQIWVLPLTVGMLGHLLKPVHNV
ncbi:hypothetical protein MELA_02698, partial [Candidatus Methylomirabilis lanthanidiphila]